MPKKGERGDVSPPICASGVRRQDLGFAVNAAGRIEEQKCFADRANVPANRVYRSMGFDPIAEVVEIHFLPG